MRPVILLFLTLLLAPWGLADLWAGQGARLHPVTIAYPSHSTSIVPLVIARNQGYYQEEGLDARFVLVRGGVAVQAMIAGSVDYNTAPTVDAIIRTRQSIWVVFSASTVQFTMIARPDIRSMGDLKGKVVGISSYGGSAHFVTEEMLRRHGVTPHRDAVLLTVGPPPDRFTALISGSIHATLLSTPFDFRAQELGFVNLGKASDYLKYPQITISVTQDKLRRQREEVHRVVRASLKGLRFYVQFPDRSVEQLMAHLKVSDRAQVRRAYADLLGVLTPQGFLPEPDQRAIIEVTRRIAGVTHAVSPDQVFDDSFVKRAAQELQASGWTPR
ncbi:MAG: ABC transporter substrate-binding protein [Deltaproteobacteria bacterium]|nr:ABC transporter substrate-binding protein [Deltaproteobacteria bacterium]